MIPHLSGLSELADQYDCFLLDIYGLLHNGMRVNPGTIQCLRELQNAGKQVCLFSNTPRRSENASNDQMRFNIQPSMYNHIVTAGESARVELIEKYQGKKVLFFGNDHFAGSMENLGMLKVQSVDQADFILNCIPGTFDLNESELTALLHEAKNRQLPMVCANPDLVVHIGETLHTCAGTYAAFYESIGGSVSWHGKPYRNIYDMAFSLLDQPDKSRVCALGDALRTDVRGACNYGIDSIWCLSGIHWEELRYNHKPDEPDMERVAGTLAQSAFKPTATITDFRW